MNKKKVTQPQTKPTNPKKNIQNIDNVTDAEKKYLENKNNNNLKENDNMENTNLKNNNVEVMKNQVETSEIEDDEETDDQFDCGAETLEDLNENNNENNKEETNMYKNYLQCVVVKEGNEELLERIYDEVFVPFSKAYDINEVCELTNDRLFFDLSNIRTEQDEPNYLLITLINIALRHRMQDQKEYKGMAIHNWGINEKGEEDYIQAKNSKGQNICKLPSVKNITFFCKSIKESSKPMFLQMFVKEMMLTKDDYVELTYGGKIEFIFPFLDSTKHHDMEQKFITFLKNENRKEKQIENREKVDRRIESLNNITSSMIKNGMKTLDGLGAGISEGFQEGLRETMIARNTRKQRREINKATDYRYQYAKQTEKSIGEKLAYGICTAKVETRKFKETMKKLNDMINEVEENNNNLAD